MDFTSAVLQKSCSTQSAKSKAPSGSEKQSMGTKEDETSEAPFLRMLIKRHTQRCFRSVLRSIMSGRTNGDKSLERLEMTRLWLNAFAFVISTFPNWKVGRWVQGNGMKHSQLIGTFSHFLFFCFSFARFFINLFRRCAADRVNLLFYNSTADDAVTLLPL